KRRRNNLAKHPQQQVVEGPRRLGVSRAPPYKRVAADFFWNLALFPIGHSLAVDPELRRVERGHPKPQDQ
ncbi:MAG: hypothetical protein ACI9QQ_002514, partial [Myxococcota bacterium]